MEIFKMKTKHIPITSGEARRNLAALDIMSGKVTEPPKPKHKPIQNEAAIQKNLFEWANLSAGRFPELRLLFHVANGGRRDIIEAYHLKQQGVKAGVPDLCLPVPRGGYAGLFIELKAAGGRLRDSQRQWIADLNRQNYKAVVAYGFDEARTAIEDYLSTKEKIQEIT